MKSILVSMIFDDINNFGIISKEFNGTRQDRQVINIHEEQEGAKNGALGHAASDLHTFGLTLIDTNTLRATTQEVAKPEQDLATNANSFKLTDEDSMIDLVKSFAEI